MSFLKKSFIAITLSLSTFGALPLLTSKSANAQNCPSSPAADGLSLRKHLDLLCPNGFCSGTPSVYGITVYKRFFLINPIAGGAGVAADYSSCEMTYLAQQEPQLLLPQAPLLRFHLLEHLSLL